MHRMPVDTANAALPGSWRSTTSVKLPAVPPVDPKRAAKAVSLRYVSDQSPGIRRRKAGTGFTYIGPKGQRVRDEQALRRIHSLAIPPAWTDVWICPISEGHLQATGYDARNRKQYRYHPRFREVREQTKYTRMLDFAKALPHIRRQVARDLNRKGLPREKVLAAVVRLLETTLIRVGNDEYARSNNSFGLTTLRDRHAQIKGACVRFEFRGKSGKEHQIDLQDPRLARIVKKSQDLPGQELLQYMDDKGKVCDITSTDVNAYIREIAGEEFTAKDFRTWAGTVMAAVALRELEKFDSHARAKKNIAKAVESVASRLGNTRTVCRKCYIHPAIFDAYLDGSLIKTLQQKAAQLKSNSKSLTAQENIVLKLLRARLSRRSRSASS